MPNIHLKEGKAEVALAEELWKRGLWLPGMLCFHDFKLFDHNSKMGVFP